MNDHWDDCYLEHHACALQLVERLKGELVAVTHALEVSQVLLKQARFYNGSLPC